MRRIRSLASYAARRLARAHPRQVAAGARRALSRYSGVGELRWAVEAQAAELTRLRAQVAEAEQRLGDHGRVLTDFDRAIGDQHQVAEELGQRLAALSELHDGLHHWVQRDAQTQDWLLARLQELERAHSVHVFTEWMGQVGLTVAPRISVIMPTRNRATILPRAVASVQAQHYRDWELIVVDDDSQDSTPQVLAGLRDPRMRSLRVPHGGCCAARNAALDVATGELIAYLDDDNVMHPLWLKSLAWAFTQRPEVDVAYGAFVVDDADRVNRQSSGSLPRLAFHPFDRERLMHSNVADMSAIAHRAGLPAARFDESLVEMGDWDLLRALTQDADPLVLPALACFYFTDAPDRLSGGPTHRADYDTVRGKYAPSTVTAS